MPREEDFDRSGLDVPAEDFAQLLAVDKDALKKDMADAEEYLAKFGDRVPARLRAQLEAQQARLA